MLLPKKITKGLLDNLQVPEDLKEVHQIDSYKRNYITGVASVDYGEWLHSLSGRYWASYSVRGYVDGVFDAILAVTGKERPKEVGAGSTEYPVGINSVSNKEWSYSLKHDGAVCLLGLKAEDIYDYLQGVKAGVIKRNEDLRERK